MSYKILALADFCKTGSGGTPSRKKPAYYEGGIIPWVKSGELRENIIFDTEEHVTDLAVKKTSVKFAPKGAILLAMYGATVGRMAILGITATTNQAICHIVPDEKTADRDYLYHCLQYKVPELLSKAIGGAQPNINQQIIKRMQIPLPPLAEQRRIAAILDKADALRTKRRAALAKLDTLLQSTFLHMFGDPITNPMCWEVRPFKEIATNLDSKRIPIKQADRDQRHGEYPYYGASGVIDFIDDYIFDETTILIAEDGMNLKFRRKPIAFIASGQYWVNNHAHVLAENGATKLDYLCTLINLMDISRYVTGIDQKKLNRGNMDRIPIPVPPLNLQIRFLKNINNLSHQKSKMKLGVEKSDNLFHALQQRAFKGEL